MKTRDSKKIGVILSYISIIFSIVSGFVSIPVIIKSIGQEEYGIYQMMVSMVGYLMILDFGLGNTITRYLVKYKVEKNRKNEENFLFIGVVIYFIISLIVFMIGLILIFRIDHIFENSLDVEQIRKAKTIFSVMLISFSISLFSNVFNGAVIAYEKFAYFNLMKIFKISIRLSLLMIFLPKIKNSLLIVYIDLVLTGLFLIFDFMYTYFKLEIRIKKYNFDKELFKEMITFSFFIFLQILVNQLNTNINPLLLGIFAGTRDVAIYSIGLQIYLIYCTLSTAISSVYLTSVSKMVFENSSNDEIVKYIVGPSRGQLIILGWMLSGYIVIGKYFINLWVGHDFALAWYVCLIIMLPSTIELSQNTILNVLKAKNKMGVRTVINIFVGICNVVLSVYLIKRFGVLGAAIGTAFSITVGYVVLSNIYYQNFIGLNMKLFFSETYKGILLTIVLTILIGQVFVMINIKSFILFILIGFLLSLTYFLLLYILGMNDFERKITKNILSKIRFIKQ